MAKETIGTTRVQRVPVAFVLAQVSAASGLAQELRFRPEAGDETTRRFELEISLRSDSSVLPGRSLGFESSIVVSDRTGAVREGLPHRLERTYERLEASYSLDNGESSSRERWSDSWGTTSDLAGETVLFEWNDEDRHYEATLQPPRRDSAELLQGLEMDMDFPWLLPEEPVEPGARWGVDCASFVELLFPGGDLKLRPGARDPDVEHWSSIHVAWIPNLPTDPMHWTEAFEGHAEAAYEGRRKERGLDTAIIRISFVLHSERDVLDWIRTRSETFWEVCPYEQAELDWKLEGELLALWDLESGRLHSLEGRAAATVCYRLSYSYLWETPEVERIRGSLDEHWSGVLKFHAAAETQSGAPAGER